jgi:hypothetical protein
MSRQSCTCRLKCQRISFFSAFGVCNGIDVLDFLVFVGELELCGHVFELLLLLLCTMSACCVVAMALATSVQGHLRSFPVAPPQAQALSGASG